MINEFRDSFAFVDYQTFGKLEVFDACWVGGVNKIQDGNIHVFLNFKKVGEFKAKLEAVSMLRNLISEAPDRFFEENKDVLLKDLC